MLKVLLVEDEPRIREGIRNMVHWETYGLELAGEAADGADALEQLDAVQPDLVLTDIRMPRMNGLDFIRAARARYPDLVSVILTGYDDFGYAKEALQLGVFDYILKPSRSVEVERVLLQAARRILDKRKQLDEKAWLESRLRRNAPIVKKDLLSRWLQHGNLPNENRDDLAIALNLQFGPEPLHVGLVRFLRQSFLRRDYDAKDQELIRYAGENMTAELLQQTYNGHIETFRNQEEIVWIANPPEALSEAALRAQLVGMIEQFNRLLHVDAGIAVGGTVRNYSDIHLAYETAEAAMERGLFHGPGTVAFHSDFPHAGDPQLHAEGNASANTELSDLESRLLAHLETGDYEEALELKGQWLASLQAYARDDRYRAQARATAFLAECRQLFQSSSDSQTKWLEELQSWLEQCRQAESFDDLAVLITDMIRTLLEEVAQHRPMHRTVGAVLAIIRERYAENLSLDAIAKEVYVSTPYLSTLFKQEMGINFLDYLHRYRIETAKSLLRESGLKVFAVSKMVGYQDDRYFSQMFKKWTGLTPSKYKAHDLRSAGRTAQRIVKPD